MVNNSDSTFFTQLILWTTANGISMISTWALLISILRIPKARSSPFNLYLVFSILPDAYKNLSGFIANLTNMLMDEGSPNACTVIGWNDVYWWCANLWMSFVVFMELHKMLGAAKRLQRHTPPTIPQIIKKSLAVHVVSIIMATLTLLPVDFIPKATPNSGCEAYPEPGHRNQTIFYFAFFLPVTAIAPTMFVTCLFIDIWWRKLLPINGKTRSLLFYFARLLLVIYVVAIAVIISFVFGGWVQAIAFVVFNLVGFFSVCLALMKKDVRRVWIQLWTCQDPTIEAGRNQSSYSESTHFENDSRGDNAKTFSAFSLRKSFQSFRRSKKAPGLRTSSDNVIDEDDVVAYENEVNNNRAVHFEMDQERKGKNTQHHMNDGIIDAAQDEEGVFQIQTSNKDTTAT
eukprot:g594.t1 g594   contig10:355975-357266(+)